MINICYFSKIFYDVALSVKYAAEGMGLPAEVNFGVIIPEWKNIFIGIQLLGSSNLNKIPPGSVILNLEQLAGLNADWKASYINCLKNFVVWDYSQKNIDFLNKEGINHDCEKISFGHVPCLFRTNQLTEKDIDVLFYGAINERRLRVIEDIRAYNINVVCLTGVYGDDLDRYIERSKMILNVHFYDDHIFEIVRVSYLLNNNVLVLSELNSDTEIDSRVRECIVGVEYEALAATCKAIVNDNNFIEKFKNHAHSEYIKIDQIDLFKKAIQKLTFN